MGTNWTRNSEWVAWGCRRTHLSEESLHDVALDRWESDGGLILEPCHDVSECEDTARFVPVPAGNKVAVEIDEGTSS